MENLLCCLASGATKTGGDNGMDGCALVGVEGFTLSICRFLVCAIDEVDGKDNVLRHRKSFIFVMM